MAMLPFCGYHMGDYFDHWLRMGETGGASESTWGTMPRIFFVNWFRKSDAGRWLWPGFGENSRVLKWVFERVDDDAETVDTPIGKLPAKDSLDIDGLEIDEADLDTLMSVDIDGWKSALPQMREHFAVYGDKLPGALNAAVDTLEDNLNAS